jgi:hypothetical protein
MKQLLAAIISVSRVLADGLTLVETIPQSCAIHVNGSPHHMKCFAKVCGTTNVTLSETIEFENAEVLPGARDFEFLAVKEKCVFRANSEISSFSNMEGVDSIYEESSLKMLDLDDNF